MNDGSNQKLIVNGWMVDPATNEVSDGSQILRLEPKVMDLLVYLSARPGVVVSRGQIEDDVWAGLAHGYDTVTGAIAKLRKALGDDARNPRVIETIPKKGYRLVASAVQEVAEPASELQGEVNTSRTLSQRIGTIAAIALMIGVLISTAFWYGADDGSLSAREGERIAVLPFANLSNDPEQEVFADGITEDLITDLSKISGMFVIARESSFVYRNTADAAMAAATELGVRYVLEGSVRRAGDTVRINVQLVDADAGTHIWSERYDGDLTDVFRLQDEVTRQVVSHKSVNLTRDEERRLSDAADIVPEAYDLFLQGRLLLRLYSLEANAEARDYFRRALAIDPGFARAHAAMALSHAVDITFGWSADEEKSRASVDEHIENALKNGPDSPQIHFTRAYIYGSQRRMDEAIDELRKTIALEPNFADAHTTLGLFLSYAGRPEEAIRSVDTAMRLSPHHGYIYPYHLANAYFVMGNYGDAIGIIEEVLARNQNFQQGRLLLISALGLIGRIDDAEWEVEEVLAALPDFSVLDEEQRVRFARLEDRARYIDGLRIAGLPD